MPNYSQLDRQKAARLGITSEINDAVGSTLRSRAYWLTRVVPSAVQAIQTSGYYADGDGGGALYKRVATEPSHAGKFQSQDGAWWELTNLKDVRQVGGNGKGLDYDDAAVTTMRSTLGYIKSEGGVIAMKDAITGEWAAVLEKTGLGGDHPLNEKFPAFGTGALWVATNRYNNGIIGITYNDSPIGTPAFPAGITGYGRNDNTGNSVFGLFGRADQYASAGTVANEVNSFNWSSTPASAALPPLLGPGSTEQHPVALIVAAGGINDSSIGIFIGNEGESPQQFKTGLYIHPNAAKNYGIYIDADADTHRPSLMARHSSEGVGISIRAKASYNPAYPVFNVLDASGFERFSIKQSGVMYFGGGENNQTTVGVAGAAATVPIAPTGYLKIEVNGSPKVIPYYEA